MPVLAAFVIRHFGNGFLLGSAAALAAIALWPETMAARLVGENIASLVLVLFAFGASFGMGSLATALWMETDER